MNPGDRNIFPDTSALPPGVGPGLFSPEEPYTRLLHTGNTGSERSVVEWEQKSKLFAKTINSQDPHLDAPVEVVILVLEEPGRYSYFISSS